jgi:hypothetical protein
MTSIGDTSTNSPLSINFNVHIGTETMNVTSEDLDRFATLHGLKANIPGRYSAIFCLNLLLLEKEGIDPAHVIAEVKALEIPDSRSSTKQESQFTRKHLNGLWHKHFLPPLPSAIAHNLLNQLGKNGMEKIANEVFNPALSPTVTKEMLDEFTDRIVNKTLEQRAEDNKLTGEWIVYAKENGKNYYLGIWSHRFGDENIAKSIQASCLHEFPFLEKYFTKDST